MKCQYERQAGGFLLVPLLSVGSGGDLTGGTKPDTIRPAG